MKIDPADSMKSPFFPHSAFTQYVCPRGMLRYSWIAFAIVAVALTGCRSSSSDSATLLLATTTSTRDSGLTDEIIPVFEKKHHIKVRLIAVGTGKALELGRRGEVDAILVHSELDELEFIQQGHGVRREPVMYNHFELLGPPSDPARIKGKSPIDCLRSIRTAQATFVSRADNSGTHKREQVLWDKSGEFTLWDGLIETGQGMGESLMVADQKQAYILCDRGTYLSMRSNIDLVPLAIQTSELRNHYGVLSINPEKNARINHSAAELFVDFLISAEGQQIIAEHQVDDERLFHPLRLSGKKEDND